jgi:fructokinase
LSLWGRGGKRVAAQIITLGELLIDFISLNDDAPLERVSRFARNAGGAPANVAVAAARLGARAAFAGCVGDDPFGRYLVGVLAELGVETGYVSYVQEATTLAFVAVHRGEPDYHFVRNPGADNLLAPEAIDRLPVGGGTILHFGSNSLAVEPIRSAILHLLGRAEKARALVSFDVNLRPAFWADIGEAPELCRQVAARAQIVKVNRDELAWLTGAADVETGLDAMRAMTGGAVVCTLGAQGSALVPAASEDSDREEAGGAADAESRATIHVPGVRAKPVNTTGAGDAFIGALLYRLAADLDDLAAASNGLPATKPDGPRTRLARAGKRDYEGWLRFAAAVAACNVEHPGVMDAMPDLAAALARLERG